MPCCKKKLEIYPILLYALSRTIRWEAHTMTTSFQMFLLAARELNFSRAAELAYVTPQCLSDHIRRIEERYGVTLFTRKPRLRLTAEGETMVRYLTRIRALEDGMENELADISGGARGTLRLGLPMTRGGILLPQLVTRYSRQFPHVESEIRLGDTKTLEELLLGGALDLFLGVDASEHALFRREPLCREPLYLVISCEAMRAQFGTRYEAVRTEFLHRGAELRQLAGVPFVQGHSGSTTTLAVEQLLLRQNTSLRIPLRVSSFDLHIDLCRMGGYATICARSHLRRIMEQPGAGLEVYAVRGARRRLEIELITHRDAQPLAYRTAFAQLLSACARREDEEICAWLEKSGVHTP